MEYLYSSKEGRDETESTKEWLRDSNKRTKGCEVVSCVQVFFKEKKKSQTFQCVLSNPLRSAPLLTSTNKQMITTVLGKQPVRAVGSR